MDQPILQSLAIVSAIYIILSYFLYKVFQGADVGIAMSTEI